CSAASTRRKTSVASSSARSSAARVGSARIEGALERTQGVDEHVAPRGELVGLGVERGEALPLLGVGGAAEAVAEAVQAPELPVDLDDLAGDLTAGPHVTEEIADARLEARGHLLGDAIEISA